MNKDLVASLAFFTRRVNTPFLMPFWVRLQYDRVYDKNVQRILGETVEVGRQIIQVIDEQYG